MVLLKVYFFVDSMIIACKIIGAGSAPYCWCRATVKSDFDSYLPKIGLKAALCRGKT
jgi:hypothetical protein